MTQAQATDLHYSGGEPVQQGDRCAIDYVPGEIYIVRVVAAEGEATPFAFIMAEGYGPLDCFGQSYEATARNVNRLYPAFMAHLTLQGRAN